MCSRLTQRLRSPGYGSGLISTAYTTLKTAVVAPMPSASVASTRRRRESRALRRNPRTTSFTSRSRILQCAPGGTDRARVDPGRCPTWPKRTSACRRASSGESLQHARALSWSAGRGETRDLLIEAIPSARRHAWRKGTGYRRQPSSHPQHEPTSAENRATDRFDPYTSNSPFSVRVYASSTRLIARDMRRQWPAPRRVAGGPPRVSA